MNFLNLDWSYIMDIAIATIIGALIAVAGSIVVNWLGNRKGYKDIDSKIGKLDNTTLSGQHNKMSEDVIRTINESTKTIENKVDNKIGLLDNTTLSGQNKEIIKKVEHISTFLIQEKESKSQKNDLLNYDMQRINNSIENLSGFSEIMKNIVYENCTLKYENQKLKFENEKLAQENAELHKQLNPIFTQDIIT